MARQGSQRRWVLPGRARPSSAGHPRKTPSGGHVAAHLSGRGRHPARGRRFWAAVRADIAMGRHDADPGGGGLDHRHRASVRAAAGLGAPVDHAGRFVSVRPLHRHRAGPAAGGRAVPRRGAFAVVHAARNRDQQSRERARRLHALQRRDSGRSVPGRAAIRAAAPIPRRRGAGPFAGARDAPDRRAAGGPRGASRDHQCVRRDREGDDFDPDRGPARSSGRAAGRDHRSGMARQRPGAAGPPISSRAWCSGSCASASRATAPASNAG